MHCPISTIMLRSTIPALCVAVLGAGCPAPGGDQSSSQGSTSATSDATSGPTTGATSTTGATTSPTSPTTSTPTENTSEPPTCGDGDVQEDEACDDGNAVNGDGCNIDCQPSSALVWEYQSGATGPDRIFSLALDAEGSIVVGGFRNGDKLDKWLAKFSASGGEPLWSEQYSHGDAEAIRGIAVAPTGIYAVGGTNTPEDSYDIWVAGLSNEGQILWEDTLSSGFGPDYATAVTTLPGGDAIVAGLLTPESQVGGVLWVRRYAPDGAVKWTGTVPDVRNPLWSLGPGISANEDRIVVGSSRRVSPELLPDLLVAFGHDGGAPLWTTDFADKDGLTYALAHAANGELVTAGRRDSLELEVRRISATGDAVLWESKLCTGGSGRAIAVDKQGDVIALGDGDGETGADIRLCKFTSDGTLRWSLGIDGGFGDDVGYALGLTDQDYIVVGGGLTTSDASTDAWLAMYTP